MLIILFILLEIFSIARSGQEEIPINGFREHFDGLPTETQESLSLLQFQPSILDFLQRSIGDPHDEKVYLFNKHKHKKVYLGRITGSSSSDFYSSYFEDKIIGPESNTSFKIVFLPRQLGETNSSLVIHTSFGVINYQMRGIGIECQYRLRPLIGIRLPINATISPEIQLYNPHDFTLQISEIYSSGGEFQLELPTNLNAYSGHEGDYTLWEIPSYTTKPIIRVRFNASRTGNYTAYVRIKIAASASMKEEKMLVVPIEIEVHENFGLYAQQPLFDLGMIGKDDGNHRYTFELLNSGQTAVSVKTWGIESGESVQTCMTVDVVQFRQRNFTDYLTIDTDWSKCDKVNIVTGFIYLIADDESADEEFLVRFPFYAHIINGNLSYNVDNLKFLRSDKKSHESPRSLIVKNQFGIPLAITNLTVPESCSKYFKVSGFKPTILQPGAFLNLLEIQAIATLIPSNVTTIEERFRVTTNVTDYNISIWSYTGMLRRIVPVDFARERSQIDEKALNFGALLPVGKQTELLIAYVNENPISIEIKHWKGAITSGNGQAQISTINRGCSRMSLENLIFCSPFVKPGEWIVFSVSVQSNMVGTFGGNFMVRTPFEEINTPVKFSTAMGRLELKSKMIFEDCFPGKICSMEVQAYSTFMKKMYVEGIAVDMDGISYEFAKNKPNELPIILPNVDTNVGKLFFSPKETLCRHRSTCYSGFEILTRPYGEIWMRSLENFTEYTLWDNEKLRAQLNSFMEVKQNIKQMQFRLSTSQIRRYEFNASINFIWPRLLKGNIDFDFVQVDRLETRFVDILNPSDQPLFVHIVLHNVTLHGDRPHIPSEAIRDCPNCVLSIFNPFAINTSNSNQILIEEIRPRQTHRLGVNFYAQLPGTYSTLLYLRNNLTVVEAGWITAKAVMPQFKFGNRKPGNATPLTFEINEKHLRLCEKKTGANILISSKRTFTAKNYGEVPLDIYGIRIEGDLCVGYGFKVLNCEPFTLQPNESRKIEIGFSPDFTLSRVVRTLHFDTSIGSSVNFTLIGSVASPALEICEQNVQRPTWEADFKSKVLIVLFVALALVLISAAMDSDRILKEHVRAIVRERGLMQAPLDLRKIALETNGCLTNGYGPSHQEQLNNLNNHHTSLNNIRKRLTITKNLTALKNKITGVKAPPIKPVKCKSNNNEKADNKKSTTVNKDEDDSNSSSSSSKENVDVKANVRNDESPPLSKNKNGGKKSKNYLNVSAETKNGLTAKIQPIKVCNKDNNNSSSSLNLINGNGSKIVTKENKNKILNTNSQPAKSHSPTSNASSNEGHPVSGLNFTSDCCSSDGNGNDVIKNVPTNDQKHQNNISKITKPIFREKKIPLAQQNNSMSVNNSNNLIKRVPVKENKQFTYKQNFPNFAKLPSNINNLHNNNAHQNFFPNNWLPQTTNIWSNTSYSEIVAQPTVDSKPNLTFTTAMGGHERYNRSSDLDFIRSGSFNRSNDASFNVDQEMMNGNTQYGPIGTRKSPSSTPSWEPLNAGINHHIPKPMAYNSTGYFPQQHQQQFSGQMQQSKLMNLMSYNDSIQQQQMMDERYQYIMKMKELQQVEWMNTVNQASPTSASSLWSSSNWATPSPPLSVPPGFENQYSPPVTQQNGQGTSNSMQNGVNCNGQQAMPAYDPFKSLSAIWEPNKNENNNSNGNIDGQRDNWNI
ncbi:hypothetical protein PVAND_014867 [Polypedilum vanderplanki]|uniref:Transmembrane protein 131-like protein n=1 Tax=Polypedilum vanderplanki TaxID=319348 RepID=A0A9J6BBF1_POLVA|nr:hypothetical protein PVAND_014867 [Polypedilum vanderplanki]